VKKSLDNWTDEILEDTVFFRIFKSKTGFAAFCKEAGGPETHREYPTKPSRDKVKADFTKDFLLKRQKRLGGDEPELLKAIERSSK
jgi:hypothetical protein